MEPRLAAVARPYRSLRTLVLAAVLGGTSVVSAAPKRAAAKVAFDRGLAAYQRGEYETASAALGKSFALEADVETLFAWAQSERQADHCDKAVALYRRLLKYDLPAANAEVIRTRLDECKAVLSTVKPEPTEPVVVPPAQPDPDDHTIEPHADKPKHQDDRSWWQDPIGDSLVVVGVAGIGIGIGYLFAANTADHNKDAANHVDLDAFARYSALADHDGKIGVTALIAGTAVFATGIAWYALHRHHTEPTVTGWLTPTGSGVAVLGRF